MDEIQIKKLFNEFDINNLSEDNYKLLHSLCEDGYIKSFCTYSNHKILDYIRLKNNKIIKF